MEQPQRCPDHRKRHQSGCRACRDYTAAWQRRRTRLIAYGQWRGLQDAGPARDHLRELVNTHGMSLRAVAEQAGVARTSIARLLHDDPPQLVRAATADALLACRPPEPVATSVDPTLTGRQLQALTALGHPISELAEHLGVHPSFVARLRRFNQPDVRAEVAAAVDRMYTRLEGTPGRCDRARALARERGWAPPLAWDGIDMADPDAKPDDVTANVVERAVRGRVAASALTSGERLRVVRRLLRHGLSDREIAERLRWRGGRRNVAQYRAAHGLVAGRATAPGRAGLAVAA